MGRPFILLDRDGTLIEERHYLSDPEGVVLLPGAAAGLRRCRQMGFGLALITNQSGIGRGYFGEARLQAIHDRLESLLEAQSVHLDGIYHCPHTERDGCSCRKPADGLVRRAARELDIDLRRSFVIGDKACDIELGERVGATTLLVRTGYGRRTESEGRVRPDGVLDGLSAVAAAVERRLAAERK